MSLEIGLWSYSIVYIPREHYMFPLNIFMFPQYSLCPTEQFMSSEYRLCPQSTVYVPRVQFISHVNRLCP